MILEGNWKGRKEMRRKNKWEGKKEGNIKQEMGREWMKGRKSEIGGVERKKEEDRMKDIEGGKDIGGEERS